MGVGGELGGRWVGGELGGRWVGGEWGWEVLYLAVDVVPTTTSLSLEIPKGDDSILQLPLFEGWICMFRPI